MDDRDVYDDYEETLVSHIKKYLRGGSKVVIVGGGLGVSSVVAVCSGASEVDTFEASSDRIETVRETLQLNKVSSKVSLHHAIVESEIKIDGAPGSAKRVDTEDLPNCDILILDCEGTERQIVQNLCDYPNRVIIECHPMFGVTANEIIELLESVGYKIINMDSEQVANGEVTIVSAEL